MATIQICLNGTIKRNFRNILGILNCLKHDETIKFVPMRCHHISSQICRNHLIQPQHKLLLTYARDKKHALCFKITRAASTGIHHEVRWNVSEPKGQQVASSNPLNGDNVTINASLAEGTNQGQTVIQNASTVAVELSPSLDNIPEPPAIPPAAEQLVEQLTGEPTFSSIGLGGWTPVGIVQNCLEYLHVGCDLPWWTSIMIGTVVVRILIFPLVILAQRNAAKMGNNLPQLQILQLKMTEARQTGNQLDAARYAQEMMLFMKEKQLNPFKNMIVPLAQAPLFISFFMGLRGMTNVPVDSMKTGGLFWFTDLTVPDQYYLMPVITSLTLWVTIELGADGIKLNAANLQTMRYILRALPVVILPFTINFPGAILVYWVSTNFISLLQVGFLKIPRVRKFFKIEKAVHHDPESLPVKPKGFVTGIKESWTNLKISKELEERQRFDEIQFQKAGKGPVQKTYKYDPTKPRRVIDIGKEAIAAKKQDR